MPCEASYASPRDLMERALGSQYGIRVRFSNRAQAQAMKNRCQSVISIDRKQSKKIWNPDDPAWNKSAYDGLTFLLRQEWELIGAGPEAWNQEWTWLYINPEHCPNTGLVIEELGPGGGGEQGNLEQSVDI